MSGKQRWVPLESNPDVLNKYIDQLGVPSKYQFTDIFGLETDLLSMVPRPVLAVMLLYPITDKSKGETIGKAEPQSGTYFVKQTIGNACGTVAIVHALANNKKIGFIAGKPFANFMKATIELTPDARAEYLENDKDMGEAHGHSASEGQTEAPPADEKVNTHFVAFIHKDGKLYEMNGSNPHPTLHGDTSADTLLEDTAGVVKKFMERDPAEVNFTLMALSEIS